MWKRTSRKARMGGMGMGMGMGREKRARETRAGGWGGRHEVAEAAAAALYLPCAGQVPLARVAFEGNGNVIEALPLQNCRVLFT